MAYTREQYIEKIKGLLAIANDTRADENEAIAAAAMAQKLMAKYNIDIASVETSDDDNEEIVSERIDLDGRYKWKYRLANIISKNFCCKTFVMGTNIVFYGYKMHAETAKEVFKFLYDKGNKLSNNYYYKCMKEGRQTKGVKNTFILGYCDGIKEALDKQCTALMLVTPKEVEDKFNMMMRGAKMKDTTMKRSYDEQAYEDGRFEGRTAMNQRAIESA